MRDKEWVEVERVIEPLIKKHSIEAFDWLVKGEVGSLSISLNKTINILP